MSTPKQNLIIIGGGISGLLAAWHLRRPGLDVEIWEASGAPGGWAQTLPWPGPNGEPGSLERGPQALRMRQGSALARLVEALHLQRHPAGPRGPRWLGKNGQRHPSPTTLAGFLGAPGLGLADKLRVLAEPCIAAGTDPDESLHACFARRLGQGFARELLPALVASVLAAPPESLGLEAMPQLRNLEALGGLLRGNWRLGTEHTWRLAGGTGDLARTLTARLGGVLTNHPARSLEALPGGSWRVHGESLTRDTEQVVLALPAAQAAALLDAVAPQAAVLLTAIPALDLRIWHSRHPMLPGWERGIGLRVHPPENRGLLGAVSVAANDPSAIPGLLHLRTYLGGAFPIAPALQTWPGVLAELRRWLPELEEPLQVWEEHCPGAFPLLAPGHGARLARLTQALPSGLHWIGAARFGPGLPELAEGIEAWAQGLLAP